MLDPILISQLPNGGSSHDLEGYRYGDVDVSIILFDGPPGSGPRLHRHPYAEVFIVQEGRATFTIDDRTVAASAGQILIALPGQAHAFINSGDGPLRQIDIHCSRRFVTEWLEP
jgi:quercetin dioxygenase-like cupin family protein